VLRSRDRALHLDAFAPRIMGILNLTPDSFSDGGRFLDRDAAVDHALAMIDDGAAFVDVGAESTRPGAEPVPDEIQIARAVPVIEAIRAASDAWISIDTTRSAVAAAAIGAGADVVNDTSALGDDPGMASLVSETGVAVVLMHRKGVPSVMQVSPHYVDFVPELVEGLREAVALAATAGIPPDRLLVDPGVGFGKRLEDNLDIHRSFPALHALGLPILFGSSRKSFLGTLSGLPASARLAGSIASNVIAAWQGAHVLRVHDVAETCEAVSLVSAVLARPAC
jgi:dihydropteroate synthase